MAETILKRDYTNLADVANFLLDYLADEVKFSSTTILTISVMPETELEESWHLELEHIHV